MPHGVKRRSKRVLKRSNRKRRGKRLRSGRGVLSRAVLLKTLEPKRAFKWDDTDTWITCDHDALDYGADRDLVQNCWLNGNVAWYKDIVSKWPYTYDMTDATGAPNTGHYPSELPLVEGGISTSWKHLDFVDGWESFLVKNAGHLDANVLVYEVTSLKEFCPDVRSNNIGVAGENKYWHASGGVASPSLEYTSFKTGNIENFNIGCTPCSSTPSDTFLTHLMYSAILMKGHSTSTSRETPLTYEAANPKVTAMHVYGGNDGSLSIETPYSPQFLSGLHGKFNLMDLHKDVRPYFKVKQVGAVTLAPGAEAYWKLKHRNFSYDREQWTDGNMPIGIQKGAKTLVFLCYGQFAHSAAADGTISSFSEAVTALKLGGVAPVALQVRHKYGVSIRVPVIQDTVTSSVTSFMVERKQDENIVIGFPMRGVQQEDPVTETGDVN